MDARIRRRKLRGQRGLSLVEVMVSFFLLFVVTLAILEMLTMAYLTSLRTEMRTELTYKVQQVVEQVNLQRAMGTTSPCCPVTIGNYEITNEADACFTTYWGPGGANIVELGARYDLRYNVATSPTTTRLVLTVEGRPTTRDTGFRYLGDRGQTGVGRVVRYVAEI